MKRVYIKEKNESKSIYNYLKPEYVYIPCGNNSYLDGDYIYKNDRVLDNLFSPISGYIRGNVYKVVNDERVKCLVIENDYKEKYRINRYNHVSRSELISIFKANDLIDDGDYNIKYLVINAIDIEPYIFSKRVFISNNALKIFGIIDEISNLFDIPKVILAISSDLSYDDLFNYNGIYPKIKVIKMDNYYPIGNNKILFREIFGYFYNKNSLEKKVWMVDLLSLYDIESIVKNRRLSNERIITIGGNGIKNGIVNVKIGTSFREVIKYLGGYKIDNPLITIGGLLTGKSSSDDFIITRDINAVFVTKKMATKESECNCCGKCSSVCPINLVPIFIMKNINNRNNLKKLDVYKCLECGLCSYICPSHINLSSYLNTAKEVIKDE